MKTHVFVKCRAKAGTSYSLGVDDSRPNGNSRDEDELGRNVPLPPP